MNFEDYNIPEFYTTDQQQIPEASNSYCRFCLNEKGSAQIEIDDKMRENFHSLMGFQLSENLNFPTLACISCPKDIEYAVKIKQNILQAQNRLSELLDGRESQSIKEEIYETVLKYEPEELESTQSIYLNADPDIDPNQSSAEESSKFYKVVTFRDAEEEKYQCTVCNQTYMKKKYLRRHQLKVHPRLFSKLRNKVSSRKSFSGEQEMLECDDCGRQFSSAIGLKKHLHAVHKKKVEKDDASMREKVSCPECNLKVARWSLKTHILRIHERVKRFQCDICGKMAYQKCEIEIHMKTKHASKSLSKISCHLCPKVFLRKESLKTHINVVHLNIISNVCDICGQGFQSASSYDTHMRSKHTFEKPYHCEECNKRFHSTSAVRAHKIRNHSKNKVSCDICSQIFANLLSLQAHKKRMHEERNYPCTFEGCGKKFVKPFLLRSHLNVHFQMKKFQCPNCDLSYYNSTHLKRHFQSIHMKVKIPCELSGCNSRFAQKNTYRNHIISHHKDLGEEGTQYMLKKIREMQLPTPSFESVNYTEEIIN